jgi:exopolysaccharide biosynthesis polyprenyl glycosylphosphotransferase
MKTLKTGYIGHVNSASQHSSDLHPADLRSPKFASLRRGAAVGWSRIAILVSLDAASVALAHILAGLPTPPQVTVAATIAHPHALGLILVATLGLLAAHGLYREGDRRRDYWGLIKVISLANLLFCASALGNPGQVVDRTEFFLTWLLSLLFICACRFSFDLATRRIRQHGEIRHAVFVISEAESRDRNIELIDAENCYNILGIADAHVLDRNQREATFERLRRLGVEEVFVSWDTIKNRLYLCWHFQRIGITLRILPSALTAPFPKAEFSTIGGVPSFIVRAPMLVGIDYWLKRCFDFCFAAVLLILFSPVYLMIALLIKIDSPGSVFFKQTRVGLHGQVFQVWKFRTMVADADKLQAQLEAQNEMKDGILFKMKDDPRITGIGKFLRNYSLDELPQLFNILLGEMSFIGPRPLPVRDVERFEPHHFIRQEVLPGISGLWQVSGRSDIDNFEDAVNLDLTYIVNWSLWLDIKIIFQTVGVVLNRSGAY